MKYAVVDTATSGDNTIVPAVTSKRIRVVSYQLVAAGTVTARWKDGASINLSGAMSMAVGIPLAAGAAAEAHGGQQGYFETSTGNALVLNLGGNVQVSGHISYTEQN